MGDIHKGVCGAITTPQAAAILTLYVTAMSVSAALRSGPAAFKDLAPARSFNRSVPRPLAHIICCCRRLRRCRCSCRWRVDLSPKV